ncbi:MAG: hypothetical protein IRY99_19655, partial [Isosphaeraceae bacterium]|nr:hypothetical protein [Isosphaeraceae bacterium]
GMLVKVFPGVVAASTVAAEVAHSRRQRGRGLAALGLSLAVGLMLWAALGGRQAVQSLRYHTERGIEIGSLYSGLLLAVGKGTGAAVGHHYNHASEHIQAPGAITAAALAFPLQAAALLLVLWRSRCSRGADGVRYAGAAVLALLVAGKVLSPQYLIWILPFVTVQGGSTGARARWLLLTCCLATALLYPWAFDKLVALRWSGIILLNLRNALLLGLWGLLLFGREAPGIARTAAGGIVRGSHLRYNGQGNCANDPSPEPAGGPSLAAP